MRWILLTATLITTAASAVVGCFDSVEVYGVPRLVAATVDGEDSLIEPTPDEIWAGPDQTVEFTYGEEVVIFTPVQGAQ